MNEEKEPTGEGEVKQKNETEKTQQEEAAGVENEESREKKAPGETLADSGQAGEPADDPEPADEASGAVGGAGEDSSKGGADSEGGAGVAPMQPELDGQINIPDAKTDGKETGPEAAGVEQYVEKQKRGIIEKIRCAESLCADGRWDELVKEARDIITLAESVRDIVEVWNG